ncbi:MAG: substrate-binding domain-containing protein [Prochloraceae cyanobacterium]
MWFQAQRTIARYSKRIDKNPEDAQAYKQRGCILVKLHEYEKAILDCSEAILLNPQDLQAYYFRGIAFFNLKRYQEAISDWNEVILFNSQLAEAYYYRGQAYAVLQEYEQAIADFEQVILLNPECAQAYHHRALIYHAQGEYNQASADYEQSIRLEPNNSLAQLNRSIIDNKLKVADEEVFPGALALASHNQELEGLQPYQGQRKVGRTALGVLGSVIAVFCFLLLILPKLDSPEADAPSEKRTTFQEVKNVPQGVFNYGGSASWASIRGQVDPVIQAAFPEFKLRYLEHPIRPTSSGTGIEMLLNHQLALAQSSRPLKLSEYRQAQQHQFSLVQLPIAIDGIVLAVNPSLNVPGLTVTQLRDIYLGKLLNWQQVGGPNLAIVPYSKSPSLSGSAHFFVEHVLEQKQFGSHVKVITNTTQTLREVAAQRGAIYYGSASKIIGQCTISPLPLGYSSDNLIAPYQKPYVEPDQCPAQRNQINYQAFRLARYPLTRDLYVIVKQNGQIEQQAGEAYARLLLSDQGQELIEKAGLIRIR